MKFIKYTDRGKIEKYVNEIMVVTFTTTRDTIKMTRIKHFNKERYIQGLLQEGYTRVVKVKAGA